MVSTATRLPGSSLIMASRMASLIWSAILSGWPSVTDSDVNRRRATSVLPSLRLTAVSLSWAAGSLAATNRILQPDGDKIPHHVGQGLLQAAPDRGDRPVGTVDDGLVVRRAEPEPVPHRIDDEQVTALPGQLGPGRFRRGVGLRGEPDQDLRTGRGGHAPRPFGIKIVALAARAPYGGQPGQDVRVLGQAQRFRRLPVLLDLPGTALGR